MRNISLILLLLFVIKYYSFGQDNLSGPIVQTTVYFDVSPPLRDIVKNLPPKAETSWKDGIVKNKFNIRQRPQGQEPGGLTDPNLQKINGPLASDTTIVNFDGGNNTQGVYPPDTHGDVGPNHYFQVVNCHYSIYSKTGALLLGPLNNSTIFNGLSNNSNDGDAIVLYDEQADRWLFSQFSLPNYPAGPFYQMIAVSTTGDPTGSWYRYQYTFTNMPDYPKFGVWGDGYYMSMHMFTATSGNYAGIGAVAYNRTLMLAGSPAATMITFTKSSSDEAFGWLPSDCDGPFPAGNPPNSFLYSYDGSSNDHLGIYDFHVDWVTTANSTFSNFVSLPVNAFTTNLSGCIQPGTTVKLDALNDRMMYRLQYRSFAGYSTLVCNHTVDISSTIAGIRWYELRKTTGNWSIYQQGTYSLSDNNSRWMASIAMDSIGNIAMGYSVSGSTRYPSIRYTGRKNNDVLNQMTMAEKGIFNGGGSQTGSAARWGDYSAISCDPKAKATFWYTQEYMATTSSNGWRTRIASFSFATPPFVTTLAATNILLTSATLNGSVTPNNKATTYYFEWGTTASYGNTTVPASAGSGNSAVAVNANLAGLTGGVNYHYRAVASNTDGIAYGGDLSFTTGVAIVTTTAASSITFSSASSGGNVLTDGGLTVTARGVCWALTPNPVVSGNHTADGSGTGTFASSITGLSPTTLYHVRAYATNSTGTSYGDDLTFTTACGTISSFPWNEGFENGDLIPNCWSQEQVNSSGVNWVFITGNGASNPAAAHGGTYNACLKDLSSADNKTRLITPKLNLTLVTSPQLKFWHTQEVWNGNQDQLDVYYKTSAGGTWTLLASYTASVAAWTQRTISLPNISSEYYIAFQGNAKYGRGVCIDDVQVSSSCSRTYPVSVSIAASANPVCQGTSVTFTATPINGGTTPAYQWKVNAINAGSDNALFSYIPASGDQVSCVLTSNITCTTGNPATSNTITMSANTPLAVGSIASNQVLCVNETPVQLHGTAPLNGTSPTYQWQSSLNNSTFNNISGATMLDYQPGSLPATTYYRQLQNATGTCGGPLPTNTLTMTVNPFLPVSVSIAPSANPACAGSPVTFTAVPGNGGTSPLYQWLINGTTVSGATNATYVFIPADRNTISCVLTSSETCTTGNPATSNTITMTVNPLLLVSVSVAVSANPVCAGTQVTFTATPVNGGGTPAYQWHVYGTTVSGATNATYTFAPENDATVSCILTSAETCTSWNPATSNTVTMTVNPLLPVSVSVAASANPVCAGTQVTYTATPVNGGGAAAYQWHVNGTAVSGATNTSHTFAPENGAAVICILTSAETCTSGNPATSNLVTMTVNPLLPVAVSVAASANPVCAGTQVTYTATPVNGGGAPAFQWHVNGTAVSGATNATYTFAPENGAAVICILTSAETCTSENPATSNTVNMTVNPLLPVGVSVAASANPVCAGTQVTYTATPVNGGGTPAYQWHVNGTAVSGGTNATYAFVPEYGTAVSCILTSAETCTSGNPATSNTVTTMVNPLLTVSVYVAASASPVCAGTPVTFTATPENGGTSPSYQWLLNGTIVPGTSNATYTFTPADGNTISCVLTSNETCTIGNPATSNTVNMTVNPLLAVSVSISASANPVDIGTQVTFMAVVVNGGTSPVYQWKVNGSNAGTNSTVYAYVPANGDVVSCTLTSAELCTLANPVNSNVITMVVNAVPVMKELQNITVSGNECFNAIQTIIVAGNGTFFVVKNGGSATMIAGQNILYNPGTVVEQGGYLYGHISAGGPWCSRAPMVAAVTGTDEILQEMKQTFYRIYPNPTTGVFTIEFNTSDTPGKSMVEIYGMKGEKVLSYELAGERNHQFSLSGNPAGIYLIRIISERNSGMVRIIKL